MMRTAAMIEAALMAMKSLQRPSGEAVRAMRYGEVSDEELDEEDGELAAKPDEECGDA